MATYKMLQRKPRIPLVYLREAIPEYGRSHLCGFYGLNERRARMGSDVLVKKGISIYRVNDMDMIPTEQVEKTREIVLDQVEKFKVNYEKEKAKLDALKFRQSELRERLVKRLTAAGLSKEQITRIRNSLRTSRRVLTGELTHRATILGLKISVADVLTTNSSSPLRIILINDSGQSRVLYQAFYTSEQLSFKDNLINWIFPRFIAVALQKNEEVRRQGDIYFVRASDQEIPKDRIDHVENWAMDSNGSHLFTGDRVTGSWNSAFKGVLTHPQHPKLDISDGFWLFDFPRSGMD